VPLTCLMSLVRGVGLIRSSGRLQTLNEYIQDTEDLVNLKLDQHRNQLIGIDPTSTTFSAAVAMMAATAGYFGMNLNRWARGKGGMHGRDPVGKHGVKPEA